MNKLRNTREHTHFYSHMSLDWRYKEVLANAGENLASVAIDLGLPPNRRTLGFVAEILAIDITKPGRLADTFYTFSGLQEMGAPSPEALFDLEQADDILARALGVTTGQTAHRIDADPISKEEHATHRVLEWLQETSEQERLGHTRENRNYLEDFVAEIVLPKTTPLLRDAVETALADPDVAPNGPTLADRFTEATFIMQRFTERDIEAAVAHVPSLSGEYRLLPKGLWPRSIKSILGNSNLC